MASDLRGVYLIGNKSDKLVTAVLIQNLASGELSTLPLQEYVHRGLEPADGTLPWEQDITAKPAAPSVSGRPFQPDPSNWGTSTWDDAAARIARSHSQRNDALLNSGGSQVFPPLKPNPIATLETAPDRAPEVQSPPPGGEISPTIQVLPVTSSGIGVAGKEQLPSPGPMSPTIQAQPVTPSPEIRVAVPETRVEVHTAGAGTAPHGMRLETGKYGLEGGLIKAGVGSLAANAEVVPAKRKPVVIRSKAQVIREAGLLITVLEDALRYHPDPHRNSPPPELWHQLNLEDHVAFQLISELVVELKRLNEFLRSQGRATSQSKVVLDLQKVGLAVLKTYGKTVAVGAGLLTIGALCTLLQHVGVGEVVDNAMLWKKIGH